MDHSLDGLFASLSDPTRRRIVEILAASEPLTTSQLASSFPVTRWAVMKHLAQLRDDGLVETLPQGRRRLHFFARRRLEAARAWLAQFP